MSGSPIPPDEALELILARINPLQSESVVLEEALGRILGEDLAGAQDVPGFDNSAMDGYAVRAADTRGASAWRPVELEVIGESRAGRPAEVSVEPGKAVRISTGAMLPANADAVVRIEDSDGGEHRVAIRREVSPGKEIRRAGEDIRAGERVLTRGTVLGPAELGVAASIGAAQVVCARHPRVAVLATGDEFAPPGEPLALGRIRNTNGVALPAQIRGAGGEVASVALVGDDYQATVEAIEQALAADVAVITGGVSVGAHDHTKTALEALGVEQVFWRVALRPGHPTWFGVHEPQHRLVFGLPGNPVSAMVTFHLFVRPALAALQGAPSRPRRVPAVMDVDYYKRAGHAHVVRCSFNAREDGLHVRPTKAQGSHVLTSMLGAHALAHLEVERGDVSAGERVDIELLL